MQLTYRGVTYQPSAPATSTQLPAPASNSTGKYRGQITKIAIAVEVLHQSLVGLTYRGVSYARHTGDRSLQPAIKKTSIQSNQS
jgi:hypothetical protein